MLITPPTQSQGRSLGRRSIAVVVVLIGSAGCTQARPVDDSTASVPILPTSTSVAAPSSASPTSVELDPKTTPTTTVGSPPFVDGGDPLRARQLHLAQLRVPEIWATADGAGQVIAIIDTGVDLSHPDLQSALVDGINLVTPGTPPQDDNGHGTHVAGIAAAITGNGVGVSGMAPQARIMPVKVLDRQGSGSSATIAAGIDWATEHGATVINLSLGESGVGSRLTKGGEINPALRRAAAAGVVLVAASGNDSSFKRDYRAGVDVVVVNACDENGKPAAFTNAGDPRAISAPGVSILSTAPTSPSELWPNGSTGYETLSGTSMATPVVAGGAALLLSAGVPASEVGARLSSSAVNPTGDIRLGAGVISLSAAIAAR